MKRNPSNSPPQPRKRLLAKWLGREEDFPETEGKVLLNVDFLPYASTSAPNVVITNGSIEFQAHKRVLRAVSSFFANLFDGDTTAREVNLPDISDDVLSFFYDILYEVPEKRVSSDNLNKVFEFEFSKKVEMLYLISKYDVKIFRELFTQAASTLFWPDGRHLDLVLKAAKSLNLNDIAEIVEGTHIRNRNDQRLQLRSFSKEIVLKMIDAHDFSQDFSFFEKVTLYYKRHKDAEVKEKLEAVGSNLGKKAWKQKYLLEKKKAAAFLKVLES